MVGLVGLVWLEGKAWRNEVAGVESSKKEGIHAFIYTDYGKRAWPEDDVKTLGSFSYHVQAI